MAAVLLLYYHVLQDGGFGNDQTVYIDKDQFNGFDFLDVEVSEDVSMDVDQQLLREGAIIYLVCDLQDIVGEHEDNFKSQPRAREILEKLNACDASKMPEINKLVHLFQQSESSFDFSAFDEVLNTMHSKYIVTRFETLLSRNTD